MSAATFTVHPRLYGFQEASELVNRKMELKVVGADENA